MQKVSAGAEAVHGRRGTARRRRLFLPQRQAGVANPLPRDRDLPGTLFVWQLHARIIRFSIDQERIRTRRKRKSV